MKKVAEALKNISSKTNLEEAFFIASKDKTFKEITSSLNISDKTLIKYTSKIEVCASEKKNCLDCQALESCKNEIKGYLYTPVMVDKALNFSYEPCQYQRQFQEDQAYQKNTFYFELPKEIKEAKMKDIYIQEKARIPVLKYLKDFLDNYSKENHPKGLYLHGNFGSGKTYLIAAAFNELAKKGHQVAIIYWPEFLRSLKAAFNDDFGSQFNYIKKIPILLIDDIGAENPSNWSRDEILGPILQHRMQDNLPTFFTSNLTYEELETHFSFASNKVDKVKARRIMERIKSLTKDIEMISKNHRE